MKEFVLDIGRNSNENVGILFKDNKILDLVYLPDYKMDNLAKYLNFYYSDYNFILPKAGLNYNLYEIIKYSYPKLKVKFLDIKLSNPEYSKQVLGLLNKEINLIKYFIFKKNILQDINIEVLNKELLNLEIFVSNNNHLLLKRKDRKISSEFIFILFRYISYKENIK